MISLFKKIVFPGLLLYSCSHSHMAMAQQPTVESLWQLIQKQQKQIEQQNKQLQDQSLIVQKLQEQLQVQITKVSDKHKQAEMGDDDTNDKDQTTKSIDAKRAHQESIKTVVSVEAEEISSGDDEAVSANNSASPGITGDDDILDRPMIQATSSKSTNDSGPIKKDSPQTTQTAIVGGDDDYLQDQDDQGFFYTGYAVANYFNFDWETSPNQRDKLDLERVALIGRYYLTDRWSMQAEFEFEHGGTGSTMEFDEFEEFGEFEQEIEIGGEVAVEELFLQYQYEPWLAVRVGQIPVPVSLINKRHRPSHYFTTTRSESEMSMIPVAWYELGVEMRGRLGGMKYRLQAISGLDSTGFSSANWVQRGLQTRFEMKNADDLAYVASLDYDIFAGAQVGGSFYYGNTTGNRPKKDMTEDAILMIGSLHGIYEWGPWKVRTAGLYGHLSNSDLVSAANRRLSNNLNVKRTPVAEAAFAWNIEAGYDLFNLFQYIAIPNKFSGQKLFWFVRYDYYDTMAKVTGQIFDNARWERETWTTGFNYHFNRYAIIKGQYSHRSLGIEDNNIENTYSLGLGVEF